jgi:ribosomal protein L16/L10AE
MLKIPHAKKFKFQSKKLFKQQNISKNKFMYPYLYILKIKESCSVHRNQVVVLNKFISKIIKKQGKIKFNNISFNSYTKKSIGIRMGKGKGGLFGWNSCLKKGSTLIEVECYKKKLFNKIVIKKLLSIIPCFIYTIVCEI